MNKIHPGDVIELKNRAVRRLVKSIGFLYIKPNTRDFETQFAGELLMLLSSFLKVSELPRGKVLTYGAEENSATRQKYLIVTVTNKFGRAESLPVLEQDVRLVKSKKRGRSR